MDEAKKGKEIQLPFPGEFKISLFPPAVLVTFNEDSSREGRFQKENSKWNPVRPYLRKSTCRGVHNSPRQNA